MKLNREDWNQLDTLLYKVGFGGYYDLMECLRLIVSKLEPRLTEEVENEKDLHTLVLLILRLSGDIRK